MAASACESARASRSHLWLAAGLVVLGGITTQWLVNAMPGQQHRPRAEVLQGELLTSTNTASPEGKGTKLDNLPAYAGDYIILSFEYLASFYYEPGEAGSSGPAAPDAVRQPMNQIPKPIRDYNDTKVAVQGFMYPLDLQRGAVKTFCLLKDQSLCCFKRMPRMNELISVRMGGDSTTRDVKDQVITVFGTLQVGEVVKNGDIKSIYSMVADQVSFPPGF